MNKLTRYLVFSVTMVILGSCSKNDLTAPPYNAEENLETTLPMPDSILRNMEGIYDLVHGH